MVNLVPRSQLSPSTMYPLRQREGGDTTVLGSREIEMMNVTSCLAGEQLGMTISFFIERRSQPSLINLKNEILRSESSLGSKIAILLGRKTNSTAIYRGRSMAHAFLLRVYHAMKRRPNWRSLHNIVIYKEGLRCDFAIGENQLRLPRSSLSTFLAGLQVLLG